MDNTLQNKIDLLRKDAVDNLQAWGYLNEWSRHRQYKVQCLRLCSILTTLDMLLENEKLPKYLQKQIETVINYTSDIKLD